MRDTLTIATNAGSGTVIVNGTSPLSYLRSQPVSVEFGSGLVGTMIWKSCVLKVQSTDPGFSIAVDSVRVVGGTFGVTGFAGRTVLVPADSLKLMVSFSPVHYSRRMPRRLLVYNDSYVGILRIPLAGYGDTFTDVEPALDRRPKAFALHQNYPNPFNPSTEITFALSEPAMDDICVCMISWDARWLCCRMAGRMQVSHHVRFNAAGLPERHVCVSTPLGENNRCPPDAADEIDLPGLLLAVPPCESGPEPPRGIRFPVRVQGLRVCSPARVPFSRMCGLPLDRPILVLRTVPVAVVIAIVVRRLVAEPRTRQDRTISMSAKS